jgi:polar amino acid transport system permease protein
MAILIALASVVSIARDETFQWPLVGHYIFSPVILKGVGTTLSLTVIIMLLATAIGVVVALCRLSDGSVLAGAARMFVWFFRGVPALVQLILWFKISLVVENVSLRMPWQQAPMFLISTNDIMTPFVSAVIGLTLHEAAYMGEIIRAGVQSVHRSQYEAAASLGMTRFLLFRRIVFPQAVKLVVPPASNSAIGLLKTTSIVSVISVTDLLYSAQIIYTRTFETIPLLIVVSFWYLVVVSVMSFAQTHVERRFAAADKKSARARSQSAEVAA